MIHIVSAKKERIERKYNDNTKNNILRVEMTESWLPITAKQLNPKMWSAMAKVLLSSFLFWLLVAFG